MAATIHTFQITAAARDAQQADSAMGVAFWRNGLTAAQFAERFPSATVIQFVPLLLRKRVQDRESLIRSIWS